LDAGLACALHELAESAQLGELRGIGGIRETTGA